MLTAKTFTGNQLCNLTTAPHPSLTLKDADDSLGRVAPSVLVKEVEKLEAELETFISRAYPSYSQGDVHPRKLRRLKDNARKQTRDFCVIAAVELIGSISSFDDPWAAYNRAFDENKTLKTLIRKGKHLIATIEADKPWLVRVEARDLTRYVKKMEPAFTH